MLVFAHAGHAADQPALNGPDISGINGASGVAKVTAEGTAPLGADGADEKSARALAVENALSNAIISAYESVSAPIKKGKMDEAEAARRKALKEHALDYLLDYRVLREGRVADLESAHSTVDLKATAPQVAGPTATSPATPAKPEDMKARPATGGAASRQALGGLADSSAVKRVNELYYLSIEASVDMRRLKKDLLKMKTADMSGTTIVTVLLLDFDDYADYKAVRDVVNGLDVVKAVKVNSFVKNKVILFAEVVGDRQTLFDALGSDPLPGDAALIPGGKDSVIIKASRKGKGL